jgi:hypothetical protein
MKKGRSVLLGRLIPRLTRASGGVARGRLAEPTG